MSKVTLSSIASQFLAVSVLLGAAISDKEIGDTRYWPDQIDNVPTTQYWATPAKKVTPSAHLE